ncbi:MAG: preprotein translocase subunit SecE [Deltaproteobacteria bacterium]|nr:preprotein translocase subunit SecE [Deltaproteobacteria bacterium]MBW2017051.1 preprotein translocase subunit SecE [Deltaproteobacteria bacterium]MBW2130016.1 preprotein translocase subunit SecE [Deltaproteobacteria bacterium]MBW2304691.1 preprotein translocase subunit SecE [Deltaproteobacteria bacterium]
MKKPSNKKKKKGSRKRNSNGKTRAAQIQSAGDLKSIEGGKTVTPTAVKREPEKRKESKKSLLKYANTVAQFLRESRMELKKVKWPTRKELMASTTVVILLVLIVAFFLWIIDFGLIKIIKNIIS